MGEQNERYGQSVPEWLSLFLFGLSGVLGAQCPPHAVFLLQCNIPLSLLIACDCAADDDHSQVKVGLASVSYVTVFVQFSGSPLHPLGLCCVRTGVKRSDSETKWSLLLLIL